MTAPRNENRWHLLIHQLPPKPAYLRVKVSRRLAQIGALALKNTVYVLPASERALHEFRAVRSEIVAEAGDATVLGASLIEGLTDAQVEAMFREVRDADYAELAAQFEALLRVVGRKALSTERRVPLEVAAAGFERQLDAVTAIDFFNAPRRHLAVAQLQAIRNRLTPYERVVAPMEDARNYRARMWVTRQDLDVDRIASAWLIRRHIDPEAKFKFVNARGHKQHVREIQFDMHDGEFVRQSNVCTFEVLCRRFGLTGVDVMALSEIVHDMALKESRYNRPETEGVASVFNGLILRHKEDETRLQHGFELFDQLVAVLKTKVA